MIQKLEEYWQSLIIVCIYLTFNISALNNIIMRSSTKQGLFTFFLVLTIHSAYSQQNVQQISLQEYNLMAALSDAPDFTLAGKSYYGKIQSVYDGDTVKIILKIGQSLRKFDCRLNWIDTPQIKTGLVKQFGIQVRDILSKMILNKIVKVEGGQYDKYGRVLVTIYAYKAGGQLININTYIVNNGMGKFYYGGTKQEFIQADYDYFIQNFRNTAWPQFQNYPYESSA